MVTSSICWTSPGYSAPGSLATKVASAPAELCRGLMQEAQTMTEIPEKFRDLLDRKKAFANVATVMADGSPQVTPVWFDYKDGKLRVNTARGRVKSRTMREGAKVAVAIMDPDNPYRYIQVRGHVARAVEQGADAHIDALAKKYLGKDTYPFRQPGEQRVMFEIAPDSVQTME
jgi:PPOX class probable F420-dependent enzyme